MGGLKIREAFFPAKDMLEKPKVYILIHTTDEMRATDARDKE